MKLKLLKCDWGMEHLGEMPDRLRAFAKAGYDGVEWTRIEPSSSDRLQLVLNSGSSSQKIFAMSRGRVRRSDRRTRRAHADVRALDPVVAGLRERAQPVRDLTEMLHAPVTLQQLQFHDCPGSCHGLKSISIFEPKTGSWSPHRTLPHDQLRRQHDGPRRAVAGRREHLRRHPAIS